MKKTSFFTQQHEDYIFFLNIKSVLVGYIFTSVLTRHIFTPVQFVVPPTSTDILYFPSSSRSIFYPSTAYILPPPPITAHLYFPASTDILCFYTSIGSSYCYTNTPLSTDVLFSKLLYYWAREYSNKKWFLLSGGMPQKSPILAHKLKEICKKKW